MSCYASENTVEYVISRLELTLEFQKRRTGEIAETPTVSYCFDCDEIVVDSWTTNCNRGKHTVVSSDGNVCGEVQTAISLLKHFEERNNLLS